MQPTTNTQGNHPAVLAEAFNAKWQGKDGCERANYQLFNTELCDVLGVPKPEPGRRQ